MEKPAYFILDLKLAPSPEQNLQDVIELIRKMLSRWSDSQDPNLNELVLPMQTLLSNLQEPNGLEVWEAEIRKAREYAEERFQSLLWVCQTSHLMTEAQLVSFKIDPELRSFYTAEEIEEKILALGVKIQEQQGLPLPLPQHPKPPQNPDAQLPTSKDAQKIERDLHLLNRKTLYELLARPIDPQGELAGISSLTERDPAQLQATSSVVLHQRASKILQTLNHYHAQYAQIPIYTVLIELCSLSCRIFRNKDTKAGYDLYYQESLLKSLKQNWEILTLNPLLPRAQYDVCIESVKNLGFFSPDEAEWSVYEFFHSKGTKLEPETSDEEQPQNQQKETTWNFAENEPLSASTQTNQFRTNEKENTSVKKYLIGIVIAIIAMICWFSGKQKTPLGPSVEELQKKFEQALKCDSILMAGVTLSEMIENNVPSTKVKVNLEKFHKKVEKHFMDIPEEDYNEILKTCEITKNACSKISDAVSKKDEPMKEIEIKGLENFINKKEQTAIDTRDQMAYQKILDAPLKDRLAACEEYLKLDKPEPYIKRDITEYRNWLKAPHDYELKAAIQQETPNDFTEQSLPDIGISINGSEEKRWTLSFKEPPKSNPPKWKIGDIKGSKLDQIIEIEFCLQQKGSREKTQMRYKTTCSIQELCQKPSKKGLYFTYTLENKDSGTVYFEISPSPKENPLPLWRKK